MTRSFVFVCFVLLPFAQNCIHIVSYFRSKIIVYENKLNELKMNCEL